MDERVIFLKVKVKYIEILENRNRVRKYLTQAARVRVSRMGSWIGQSGIVASTRTRLSQGSQ